MVRSTGIGLLALALSLAGCGDADTTPKVKTTATVAANRKPKPSTDERMLRAYLKRNFGPGPEGSGLTGADWYGDVKRIRLDGKTAFLETNYSNDADVTSFSHAMCASAAGAGRFGPLKERLDVVIVLDRRGGSIAQCGPQTPPS